MKLKIMTYNIAAGRRYDDGNTLGRYDISGVGNVIRREKPALCGLNEVDYIQSRSGNVDEPSVLAEALGVSHTYFAKSLVLDKGTQGGYGNAVLSRYPIVRAETVEIPDVTVRDEPGGFYEHRVVASVDIALPENKTLTVLETHFGLAVAEEQNAVDTLLSLIDNRKNPLILMGDFNIRPANYLLRPLRERLFDASQLFTPGYHKSFPSYPDSYPDCRIDYIFASPEIRVLTAEILPICISDHYPYVAEIEI